MELFGLPISPGLIVLVLAAVAIRFLMDRASGRSGCDSSGTWLDAESDGGD